MYYLKRHGCIVFNNFLHYFLFVLPDSEPNDENAIEDADASASFIKYSESGIQLMPT